MQGYSEAGYPVAMLRAAETLAERRSEVYVSANLIAEFFACAGERERAVEWLERSYKDRDIMMAYIKVYPTWDILRDESRFQDLLRRMKFPE